jgi:hypothetical protein
VICRQDNHSQFAAGEVLLIANALIAGYQHIEGRLLGCIEKSAVSKAAPSQVWA